MGRAMLVMRRLQHVVANPGDPLRYGVIFFRSHAVDSTTWMAIESRRPRTTTDASPSLAVIQHADNLAKHEQEKPEAH